MEKLNFTKGKWKIGGNTGDGVLISSNHPQNRDIATVWNYGSDFLEKQETESNALLISKAPGMLRILERCALEFAIYKAEFGQGSKLEKEIMDLIKQLEQ